jgi:hypothetical protein
VLRPRLYLGEAYMDGSLEVQHGSIWDILDLCGRNVALNGTRGRGTLSRLASRAIQFLTQLNSPWRAKRNVAHHYDLSRQLCPVAGRARLVRRCQRQPVCTGCRPVALLLRAHLAAMDWHAWDQGRARGGPAPSLQFPDHGTQCCSRARRVVLIKRVLHSA